MVLRLSPGRAGQVPGLFSLRLGSLLERAGSDQQAYALYRRVCETAPSSADAEAAWFRAGRLLEQRFGDPAQAAACYRQQLQLFPQGALALDARRALDGLRRAQRPPRAPPLRDRRPAAGTASTYRCRCEGESMPKYDLAGNPLPEDTAAPAARDLGGNPVPAPVARDLAGNPLPAAAQPAHAAAAWPPPPTAPGYGSRAQPEVNTSGMKQGVPPTIAAFKWNWGAFLLSWIWSFNQRLPLFGAGILVLGLLSAIPLVGIIFSLASLGIQIYLGVKGHQLAWENRRFEGGVPQFLDVQRAWLRWGVGLAVIGFVFGLLGAILFPVISQARMRARMESPYYSGRSYEVPGGGGNSSGLMRN